jgi:adenosylcobinamide kinase/adenosylcobinamide-phosphate guanylyltransferase
MRRWIRLLALRDAWRATAHFCAPRRASLPEMWLSNLLFAGQAAAQAEAGAAIDCPLLQGETTALIELLPTLPGHIILVTNEVGWGIVPMHAVSRIFADEQGRLNQRIAAVCDQVTLVAAGLPLKLKG